MTAPDYRDDPRWQRAHAAWLEDRRGDETPTDHLMRGVMASFAKFEIEVELDEDVVA